MMRREGSAFLLSLVVSLVVAAVTMSMAQGVSKRLRSNDRYQASAQSRQASLGMLRAVVNDLNASYQIAGLPNLVTVFPEGELIGECSVFLVGRDPLAQKSLFSIIPEAGLIDVNNARFEVMAALPGMNEQIAAAIIDWRDADDESHEAGGAERNDGYYLSAEVPYAPRNAPFESLEELRLVRGVTDAIWFGEDQNENGYLDAGEDASGDGQLNLGLRDVFCLEAREPATQLGAVNRVPLMPFNQNVAALFVEKLGDERGPELFQGALPAQPFRSRLQLLAAIDITDDEAALIWPALLGPEGRLGLIDVWSSNQTVLSATFGISIAQKIMNAKPVTQPKSLKWLTSVLSSEETEAVGPFVTHGSYQFRADITAIRKDGAAWERLYAMIDCSTGTARVLRIQAAKTLSWPFSWATPAMIRQSGNADPQGQISGARAW